MSLTKKIQTLLSDEYSIQPIIKFFLLGFGLPFLANLFAILVAGLYIQNGIFVYLFLISGVFIVASITKKFSWAVESSRQQSLQLEQLEQLGQAIITSPPDASTLSTLLEHHVPQHVSIRAFRNLDILRPIAVETP